MTNAALSGKQHASLAVMFAAGLCFAGAEWSGEDLFLHGEGDAVYTHQLTAGQTIAARHVYISQNDCGAALVADGATITASGTAYLGRQYQTNLASTVSLALTNSTMTVAGVLIVDSLGTGSSATLTLGSNSTLTASYFSNNSAARPKIYFDGGKLKTTNANYVFNPSGHRYYYSDGAWKDTWPNESIYVYANEGPIDITVDNNVKLVSGNAARGFYMQGTRGFVKRGSGVLDWVWYPSANNGSVGGDVTYTGDTVVKEGGIRVGDTYTYKQGSDTRPLRNPMPAQSPLILEANTFIDVSSNASTWCSISGAGVVTNRTTLSRGKVILGGTVADCELSPASVGGAVDVYKRGNGTLTVDTTRIDGDVIVSNGTLRVASGSTLKVRKIVLHPNTTLDARGATLTDVVLDLNGRTVGFATVSDVYVTVANVPGGTVTFGEDGSNATLDAVAEAGIKLVKKGAGALTLNAASSGADLAVLGGTVAYGPAKVRPYRHYRFKIDAIRDAGQAGMQFSEFKLLDGETDVTARRSGLTYAPYQTATAYPPDFEHDTNYGGEEVTKAVDGNLGTKWLDYRAKSSRIATEGDELYVQLDYAADTLVTAYNWATANDGAGSRDPSAWRLLASDDGESWTLLDQRTDMGPYSARQAWVGPFSVTYPDNRYDRARSFGTVTIESGATLDLRGGGFTCQAIANRGGTILRDDAMPITLTAEEGADVRLPSDQSAIAGDIVKTGAGTNTLLGTWAVDGAVTVSNGTLRCLVDGFAGKYFRMTIYKNRDNVNYMQFMEFYLYDQYGNVIDDGRPYAKVADGTDPSALAEKQVGLKKAYAGTAYGETIDWAFDGMYWTSGGGCRKYLCSQTPTAEEPIVFHFRMPASTPNVYGYNFLAANDGGGARNPVTWTFEGSSDGVTWHVLDEQVNATTPSSNSTKDAQHNPLTLVYFNDGIPYTAESVGDPDANDAEPFGPNAVVSVASGATLDFGSPKMELASLAVDGGSLGGTITRFTPAETGVLELTLAGDLATFMGGTGVDLLAAPEVESPKRIRQWQVKVNGTVRPTLQLRWADGKLRLVYRPGFLVIVK